VLDSCGKCGKVETPQACPRRLNSRPAESEHLERKSTNTLQQCLRKTRFQMKRVFLYDHSAIYNIFISKLAHTISDESILEMELDVMQMEPRNTTEAALHDYKMGLGIFTEKMPELAEQYNTFTDHCFREGVLSKKEKQLIALGISLYSQDEYCIIYHTKGCLDQGCSEEEILEAIGVTAAFGGGAVMSQAVTLVQQSIQDLNQLKQ
jgi:AhpD family alkylhydroperoxidase